MKLANVTKSPEKQAKNRRAEKQCNQKLPESEGKRESFTEWHRFGNKLSKKSKLNDGCEYFVVCSIESKSHFVSMVSAVQEERKKLIKAQLCFMRRLILNEF